MIKTFTPLKFSGLFFLLFLQIAASYAQRPSGVTGTISNDKGIPIAGAALHILNTGYNASTDFHGYFNIKNIPAGNYQLSIDASGYATRIENIELTNSGSKLDIKLTPTGKQLDEVVVTAQKRDDDSQKLPLSISAITAKQVTDERLLNTKDLSALVPNLYLANPGDNRNVTSIRGITTTSYNPAVATYIDGVNQFGLDTYIAQLEDIEQIEVLRGPQGTLFGRNALGGAINITTKQPGNDLQGFAEVDYGNYDQQRYSAGLRAPLINDKLFFGASMLFTTQRGFYQNDFTHTGFDDQHSFLGNYYLKYVASSKLSITLNVKHAENRNNGAFPLASDAVTAISNPFKVNQNAITTLIDNLFNSSLSVQYKGCAFNFTSQTAYQTNYRYYTKPIDGDFSPLDAITLIDNYGKGFNKVKVITQELRFTSPASTISPLKWIGGIYGFYDNNPTKQATHFGNDAAQVGSPITNFSSINTNKEQLYGIAAFGQATYNFTAKLAATIGARYDYEHDKLNIAGQFQADGQSAMVTRSDTGSSAAFKAFSPKASIQYLFSTTSNIFAGYSKGFRSGGISQLSSDPSQPPLFSYKPESSNNYEAGTKNSFFHNRLRVNATLFYTFVNDAQVPMLVLPDAITITRNAGKLKSKGAELELDGKIISGLEATYNVGFTDAHYSTLETASNGTSVNLNGNRQIFTPKMTSFLGLQYGLALGKTQQYKLFARGEWRYLGEQYFDLANTIRQNGYSLFNSKFGVSYGKALLYVWGANLFNKHYIDYAYDFGAAHLGNPKTYGVTLRTTF